MGFCSVFLIVACTSAVFLPFSRGSTGCQEKVADVVFLLDSSFSLYEHHFAAQLDFLRTLVDSFTIGSNNIRVGVVTYSTELRLDVALNQHMDKESLLNAIGQIKYMTGGTKTRKAIHYAHTEMFKVENGGRPWAAHAIILITDGYSDNTTLTTLEASVARSKGIELFAIGVGGGVDENELNGIASYPTETHVFRVDNYDALKHIEKSLASSACHKKNNTESSPHDVVIWDRPKDVATKRCGGKPADVVFLLDASSSIGQTEFQDQLHFVAQLLPLFDISSTRTRIGVAVYSDSVHKVYTFTDSQTRANIKHALMKAPYLTGGTNTGLAFNVVRTRMFATARLEVAHIIIVLTDGQSANLTHTLLEARIARDQGMYVFAVGIGSQTDAQELMDIASDPDENFVFHVDNFGGLKNIRELLAIKTCDVEAPSYSTEDFVNDETDFTGCPAIVEATDVIFVYDAAVVSRDDTYIISATINAMLEAMEFPVDLVRFGLVRENCHKGNNFDLKTGAKAAELEEFLLSPKYQGLHVLLQRVRLYGFLTSYNKSRAHAHKVIVLFVSTHLQDLDAVEKELKRFQFQGVRLVIVTIGSANQYADRIETVAHISPVQVKDFIHLQSAVGEIEKKLCQVN